MPEDKKANMFDLENRVEEDVVEQWEDGGSDDPHFDDRLHEIVDGIIPIYYCELLEVAAENTDMATFVPDCGPAFDGSATPTNIIAANIYERLMEVAYEKYQELKDESEDE